jgi:NitT/TauT family transport system permease protein/taurine transport system permease protein
MLKKKRKINYRAISVLAVIVFVVIWQLVTDVFKIFPPYIIPSPWEVILAFIRKLTNPMPEGATLLSHIWGSLQLALTGFFLGTAIGVPLGIFSAWYKKVDLFVRPIFDLIRPIPPVAWIPFMILLLGIGFIAKVPIIFVAAYISSLINSYSGIKHTPLAYIWTAKTFGASNFTILRKVAIPYALPMIFAGLRIGLGIAWTALVAAELLAGVRGLGFMINIAREYGRSEIILVGMVTIGAFGALMAYILELIERRFVRGA